MKTATTPEQKAAVSAALGEELDAARKKHLAAIKKQAAEAVRGSLLAQIDNEHEREVAEIRAKYADQIKNAADEQERAVLIEARDREINAAGQAYGKRQRDQFVDRADENERLRIERDMTGMAKRQALIELERQRELREAVKTGADVGQINQKYDLRQLIEGRTNYADTYGSAARGTFSAQAAALMGQGSAQERTAKATEETAKNTKQLLKNRQKGQVMQ
jgi:hypothetical protein